MEIALYNLYSMLTEIETGAVYKMSKPNDIYSGLGQQDKLLEVKAPSADAESTAGMEGKDVEDDEGEGKAKDLVDELAEEAEQAAAEEEAAKEAAQKGTEALEHEQSAPLPEPPSAELQSTAPPPPPPAGPGMGPAQLCSRHGAEIVCRHNAPLPRARSVTDRHSLFFVYITTSEPANEHAGKLATLEKRKKREAALARAIQRAETIAESYESIKVR